MAAIGRLLATLFGSLFGFIVEFFVVDKGFKVAAIVVMVGLLTGIVAMFDSCTGDGICGTAFANAAQAFPNFSTGMSIAFNSVTFAAASQYLVVWAACQLYVFKKRMTGLLLGGS
jgi:hypothetical protein